MQRVILAAEAISRDQLEARRLAELGLMMFQQCGGILTRCGKGRLSSGVAGSAPALPCARCA